LYLRQEKGNAVAKIPGPDSILYRFLAGHPLDGHYRTDARYLHRGTRQLSKAPVTRWSYLPGYQRAAVRLGVLAGLPAAVWQYLTHPSRTILAAAAVAFVGLCVAVWQLWRSWRVRRVYRTYVRPLHAVLSPLLGLPATVRAGDYITVPPSFRTREETPAVIRLPRQFNPAPGSRDLVTSAALAKLGLNEDNTDVIFRFVGDPVLHLKMAPQPPDKVLWADELEQMEGLPAGKIFVGRGARGKPYIRDYNSGELVHGGFSVQTGRGKSAAAMAWSAQTLHSDPAALVTFIDPKQSTLPTCLVGVPGYRLANDPDNVDEMWDAIFAFETEMDRRRHARQEDPTAEFSLMYLYLDELSEFADMTRERWEQIREESDNKNALPKKAPVWRAISRILRMSREYGGRVNVFTQRLDSASTGGIGLRDLLGWRGLGGYRKNQWMMLIGTMPIPKPVNRVGRWIYSDGHREVWVQNVYGTPEQLRDWAMAGRRSVDTGAGHSPVSVPSPGGLPDGVQWDIVGLQSAADYLEIPVGTFRKRRQRAGGIPGEGLQGRSPAWSREMLDNFAAKVDA
jgi:hypothetical protein